MAGQRHVVVPLRAGSDADATHRPTGPAYTLVDPPTLYLEKIGQQWMQARGEARPGVSYSLEALPAGYTLYQKPRPSKPSHIDKWLYGHPDHKTFDSPNRFFPHFQYLMENEGNSIGCPCTMCNTNGGILPSSTSSKRSSSGSGASAHSNKRGRSATRDLPKRPGPSRFVPPLSHNPLPMQPKGVSAGMNSGRVDEEGTPDVYRNLIDKLKRHGTIDEEIREPLSIDWRAEQAILPGLLSTLRKEPQWAPRVGDIVLYISDIPDGLELLQHEETGELMFWDQGSGAFTGEPMWKAGLVGQTPVESVQLEDTVQPNDKGLNVSLSGVRVESLPDPNDTNKSLSKRYKYVHVNQTRPFMLWKEYLGRLPEDQWHPTVKNALTVMATVSLIGKRRFRGTWPEAQIYCHGIYIGSELLAVGDTARLLPKADLPPICTDILIIKSIRLKLTQLDKASSNDYDEGRPYNSELWIFGTAYTSDSTRSNKQWLAASNAETPPPATTYGKWYPLHPPTKELAVPFSRILSRLPEHDAVSLWLPRTTNNPDALDLGRAAVVQARAFARANDNRISSSLDATWFWGDSRAETLDIRSVNGLDVTKFDPERNPRKLRRVVKVVERSAATGLGASCAKPATGRVANLKAFLAPSARRSVDDATAGASTSGDGSSDEESGAGGELDTDVEREIRRETRIVDEDEDDEDDDEHGARGSRRKVVVLID